MDSKTFIFHVVSNMSDAQADQLADLFRIAQHPVNTSDLLDWSDVETHKIDTAYPVNYVREIEKIYPNSALARYVYDYRTSYSGSLLNVNDVFTSALIDYLKSLKY